MEPNSEPIFETLLRTPAVEYIDSGVSAAEIHRMFGTGYSERHVREMVRRIREQRAAGLRAGGCRLEAAQPIASDKKASTLNWRDANKAISAMQALKRSASRSQDDAKFDFSEATEPLRVLPISDWHMGSYGTDHAALEQFTDEILGTPNLYLGIIGDMLQMSIKLRSVFEVSDNVLTPELQMQYLESWLSEIQHRVLFSTWDNHSVEREEKQSGVSMYRDIFARRVVWYNGIGHADIVVGSQTYRIAVSHAFRGRSMFNPVHAQGRYIRHEANDRDVVIAGDSHVPGTMTYLEQNTKRVLINCGSMQANSGYAKRYFSLHTHSVFPCFTLDPKQHCVTPYWSVAEMLNHESGKNQAA